MVGGTVRGLHVGYGGVDEKREGDCYGRQVEDEDGVLMGVLIDKLVNHDYGYVDKGIECDQLG